MAASGLGWGILSTADIARKNWLAILNSGNHVVAVASRDLKRARRFIEFCQPHAPMPAAPRAFGSYEELLESPAVQAVYIPLPTGLRKGWVLRAAAAGKHIVCEKPCAANMQDLREMLEACKRHRVQFMDGVMFAHSHRLIPLRKALRDRSAMGSVRRITSAFTFCAPREFFAGNIRADPELEPHGCLGDLGWYCIRFSLWAMGWQMPRLVTGRVLAQKKRRSRPVITEFSGELLFDEGVSAGFFCSFLAQNQEWAQVSGTKGYVRIEDFVVPFDGDEVRFEVNKNEFVKNGCEFKMAPEVRQVTVSEHSQAHPTAQEANLFREFSRQVRSARLNKDWPEYALKTQAVMEACLKSARKGATEIKWTG
jgi:predicted dehydrogenase